MDEALASLVPTSRPILWRDELEDWSSAEANLFEEAIQELKRDKEGRPALEVDEGHHRVLLHVEDHRPLSPAEEAEGDCEWEQA